ncbi:poly-gamma-glutamate synthesis protein (capsule biosynthesis protein) [Malonomonas rubra DSM 5091]|uniref:Poly-gamma-glutamate synthesis protein (Capsule biosynthesis protein) n=1 Tax=Malonomonas rubra DSM 5091 TaxID=1122189 RepID=A0A1M6KC81_MALRU|nr:CapA family protein [Malonomonas rubra]SHJ56553.1 poly-gamma-glutamate synthesis protein (capsule biosynthesis protein) [Malonomonas rubra DSM 5091]
MPDTTNSKTLRLIAIGDLMMTIKPGEPQQRGLESLSAEIRELFKSADIVLANLECTSPSDKKVATEPRVFATEEQILSLKNTGITLVNLGNNHCFDGTDEGFQKTIRLLRELGLPYFGAGINLEEAEKPIIINKNGIRTAFVSVVDKSSGMYRFASEETSGVALLNKDRLCQQISELKKQVDQIVISPHWGDERFRFPSPQQREEAKAFIDAGATMIFGHHPHVIQGLEYYNDCPVVYSLGNFMASDVYWESGDVLTWNRFERTSALIICEFDQEGVQKLEQLAIYDDGELIQIDRSKEGKYYLERAYNSLQRKTLEKHYRREKFRVRKLLPIINKLQWHEVKRIRPQHLIKAIKLLTGKI